MIGKKQALILMPKGNQTESGEQEWIRIGIAEGFHGMSFFFGEGTSRIAEGFHRRSGFFSKGNRRLALIEPAITAQAVTKSVKIV